MSRSDPIARCTCGEALPARYHKGGRPKKCEDCKQADRARREREARARRKAGSLVAPSDSPCGEPAGRRGGAPARNACREGQET